MKRSRFTGKKNKTNFRKNAMRTNRKNIKTTIFRGGYRL